MPASPVRITLAISASGRGSVVVDGIDLSNHCRAVTVSSEVGNATEVTLTLNNVEVDGWVEVSSLSDEFRRFLPDEGTS